MKEEKQTEEKRIEMQEKKPRKGFQGFPVWVWLVLLAVVGGVYVYLNLKY